MQSLCASGECSQAPGSIMPDAEVCKQLGKRILQAGGAGMFEFVACPVLICAILNETDNDLLFDMRDRMNQLNQQAI